MRVLYLPFSSSAALALAMTEEPCSMKQATEMHRVDMRLARICSPVILGIRESATRYIAPRGD
jgi:hypothetical protein